MKNKTITNETKSKLFDTPLCTRSSPEGQFNSEGHLEVGRNLYEITLF